MFRLPLPLYGTAKRSHATRIECPFMCYGYHAASYLPSTQLQLQLRRTVTCYLDVQRCLHHVPTPAHPCVTWTQIRPCTTSPCRKRTPTPKIQLIASIRSDRIGYRHTGTKGAPVVAGPSLTYRRRKRSSRHFHRRHRSCRLSQSDELVVFCLVTSAYKVSHE
jgi:hypothetical protein